MTRLTWLIPCLLYLFAVARAPDRHGRELTPTPDALEYALLAQRLAEFEAPLIPIGLFEFPSRYPLSFPLLQAPFARVLPLERLWLMVALMGLGAVGMTARVGGWLTGSRAAGGLAAAFLAWHPQFIDAAIHNMSETSLLLGWLLLLEAARPWLQSGRATRAPLARAAAAGLLLGWLAVAKAPFAYWAPALALLMLIHPRQTGLRRFGPAALLLAVWLTAHAADLLYRQWAFGDWRMNGYAYWHPPLYQQLGTIFNPRYLLAGWEGMNPGGGPPPPGNILFYGRALLGLTHDFYSPYMGVLILASAAGLVWPGRRGRPRAHALAVLAGWMATGFLFLGLYHFQSPRLALPWVVPLDWLAAWGLTRLPLMALLRRGWARRRDLNSWAQLGALLVAAVLLRGEYRRIDAIYFESPDHARPALTTILPRLLDRVPAGDWLLSNYELPLISHLRPSPGPNAALYVSMLDYPYLNGHVLRVWEFELKPRRLHRPAMRWLEEIPLNWLAGSTLVINPSDEWQLAAPDRRRLLAPRPVWLLLVRPWEFEPTRRHLERTILPMLAGEAHIEPVARAAHATLYRLDWLAGEPAGGGEQVPK